MIFEIGGGYGSFCRVLQNAGFKGLHIIYDLPQLNEVQRLFLRCSGIQEFGTDAILEEGRAGFCLLNARNFEQAVDYCEKKRPRLGIVATWSLSEMPLAVRDIFFPRLHRMATKYLITYEPTWGGLDNDRYFETFCRGQPDRRWIQSQVPGSRYLFV